MIDYDIRSLFDDSLLKHGDVLIQNCNCFCKQGKGIAAGVKVKFPPLYLADMATPVGDREKLGSFSKAELQLQSGDNLTGYNLYGQYYYGTDSPKIDYRTFEKGLTAIAKDIGDEPKVIIMPMIGAGLAGGDWIVIAQIIAKVLHGHHVVISTYKPKRTDVTYV